MCRSRRIRSGWNSLNRANVSRGSVVLLTLEKPPARRRSPSRRRTLASWSSTMRMRAFLPRSAGTVRIQFPEDLVQEDEEYRGPKLARIRNPVAHPRIVRAPRTPAASQHASDRCRVLIEDIPLVPVLRNFTTISMPIRRGGQTGTQGRALRRDRAGHGLADAGRWRGHGLPFHHIFATH